MWLIIFALIVGGFAGAVILFVPQEISFATADSAAEEGLYFAAFTFVNKSAMACAPLVIGVVLSFVGYSVQSHSESVARAISGLFIGLPAAAFLVSLVLLWFYTKRIRLNR